MQAVLEGVIPERSLSRASDLYHVHANGPGSLGKPVDTASYLCFRDTPRSKVAEGFAQVTETVRWDGLREAMLRTAGGGPEVFLDNRKSLTRWVRERGSGIAIDYRGATVSFKCPTRLFFPRSLASCSILGWLAGVGDRHLQNLLFEDATGTLVPIDFGYSFGTATTVCWTCQPA